MKLKLLPLHLVLLAVFFGFRPISLSAQILFDNGPIFNSVGTGAGGANESVLYNSTQGMGTIGFGHQASSNNRVADDLIIPDCKWRVDSIVFFAYQTGSTTTSTMTSVNLQIWDSIPAAVGSSVVYGDTTTNRMVASRWSGVYRLTETTIGNTTRPIMRNVCATPGLLLDGGTYWLDWQSAGTLASGPWAPPRTPANVVITGNARQRVTGVWANALDGGTGTPAQGFPYIIYGQVISVQADAGADVGFCVNGVSPFIGGAPSGSGGLGTMLYHWSPATLVSDSADANPVAFPTTTTSFVLTVTDSISGCSDLDTILVSVGLVSNSFLPSDTVVCVGDSITIDAGGGTSYSWSNGSTAQSVFVSSGSYSVSVLDSVGCTSVDTIEILSSPLVDLVGDTFFCPGDSANLSTSLSGVAGGNFLWSNGDTLPATSVNVAGNYLVTYTSPEGCISLDSLQVTASPNPVAAFNFLVSGNGLDYSFTDFSSGGTLTYAWDFGDGTTSTSQNPTHSYLQSGNYSVVLIVTNLCGSDTVIQNISVVGTNGALESSGFVVKPNPATSAFAIQPDLTFSGEINCELMDLQGKMVHQFSVGAASAANQIMVDASPFARGTYFLRIRQNERVEMLKVVLE
jgi:hypothetical protein